LEFYFVVISRK